MNWKSKKLWVSVLGVLVPVANALFGWGLVLEEILGITSPMMAYVIGQGIADTGKEAVAVKKK